MGKVIVTKAMIAAAAKSMFNASEWTPAGEPVDLKSLWAVTNPGLYDKIDGTKATITCQEFSDGIAKRITVPLKGGKSIDLKLSGKSDLEEGDVVSIDSIKATLLQKAGSDDIMRYDADLAE